MKKSIVKKMDLIAEKAQVVVGYNLLQFINPSDEKVEVVIRSKSFYKSIDRFEEAKLVMDYYYNPFVREIKQVIYHNGQRKVNYYKVTGLFTESRFNDTINNLSQDFIGSTLGLPKISAGGYLKFNPRNAVF